MTIVFAVLVVLAALYVTLFVRDRDIPDPIPVSPVQHLQDRKQAIYENLRDLQFEYRLGKLSDQDYQQTKLALQKELALVLAEIEDVTKALGLGLVTAAPKTAPAKSKMAAAQRTGILCPHCGASFSQSLKFCGECGKAMS